MFARSNRSRYFLAAATAVLFALTTSSAGFAEVFYCDDFESHPLGSIHGRDSTWELSHASVAHGDITNTVATSGSQSLGIAYSSMVGGAWHGAVWYDDTDTAPHAGLIEFSWDMYTAVDPKWEVSVKGWGDSDVCSLRNTEVGSISTVDAKTTGEIWKQSMAILPAEQWRRVTLQVDFDANPDVYRFKVGSSDWQLDDGGAWYTMGTNETAFRSILFASGDRHGGYEFYIDDLCIDAVPVPEPSMALLLVGGVLGAGVLVRLRKRKGRSNVGR